MCLSMHCRAPIESIVAFFTLVIGISVSKGAIWRIRKQSKKKAEVFDAEIPLKEIKEIATDEIFQQGTPVLTGIDLDTNYIFLMEASEDRSGDAWERALKVQNERGLKPAVNVSDNGNGLKKGMQKVFPGITLQPDAFHLLRDLGTAVRHTEKHVLSELNKYYKLESLTIRQIGKKLAYDKWEAYCRLLKDIPDLLRRMDEVNILYGWLKEYVAFSGYSYSKSLSLCTWILDEMAVRFADRTKYQEAIASFRKYLPELLSFLQRIQNKLDKKSAGHPKVNADDFTLLCQQRYCCPDNEKYNYIEQRLYSRFGKYLPEIRKAIEETIHTTHRASSMVENLNGRLRSFIDLKRKVPEQFLILIKVYMNTKKPPRLRHKEWKNTSAVERLTKKKYPEFLDIVCTPIDYIIKN